jgi:hypothetical protein
MGGRARWANFSNSVSGSRRIPTFCFLLSLYRIVSHSALVSFSTFLPRDHLLLFYLFIERLEMLWRVLAACPKGSNSNVRFLLFRDGLESGSLDHGAICFHIRALFAIPARLLSSPARPLLRLCNIRMASTISSEDFSKSLAS